MDLVKLRKLADQAYEAGKLMKEVTAYKNYLKDKENMRDIHMSEQFKTLREPLIKQQKKTDEKQDKIIEQLQKNQLALTSGIQDIMALNKELQPIMPGEEGAVGGVEEGEKDPKAPPILIKPDAEKFWDDNLHKIIQDRGLKTAKELYQLSYDELKDYAKTAKKVKTDMRNKFKGPPKNKDMDKIIKKFVSSQNYETTVLNLMEAKRHEKTPTKKGKGIRKQPKRHAYKIQDGQYGGLVIDLPRLYNEMKLKVFRGGKLLYSADADKSLINLITKRFNPKTKYSINAVKIFNGLNTLANMPKHRSSGKTRMVGSSVTYYNDPNQLADRMKILVGSIAARNNSPVIRNDMAQINDELLRVGAIDQSLHQKFFQKYLSR